MKLQLKTAIERTSCAFASGCEFCLVNWTPCPVYLKEINMGGRQHHDASKAGFVLLI